VEAEVETELGIVISEQRVRQRMNEVGLHERVARKKPYVSKVNRGKRLEYAKSYREKPLSYWDHVSWSDESKFNLFGSDGKVIVWRTPKEEQIPICTVPIVKHEKGNVKCSGCMSSWGVVNLVFIDGNMTGEIYHEILQKNLFESVRKLKLGNGWVMQHDNDPKHRAHIETDWLNKKQVERREYPRYSPDLNPIEHIRDEVETNMEKERPKNETELKQALLRVWQGIGADVTKS
jgi:hypothetical protein